MTCNDVGIATPNRHFQACPVIGQRTTLARLCDRLWFYYILCQELRLAAALVAKLRDRVSFVVRLTGGG